MIEKSIQILDKATDQVVKVNDLNVNAGIGVTSASILQIIVIIFIIFAIYMIISIKKSFVSDIKKKLDIDDLQNKLEGLDSTINKNNEAMIEITASIERLGENIQELSNVTSKGKRFSNQEMYKILLNQFTISINEIKDFYIEKVRNNNLHQNKETILREIIDIIRDDVYVGRDDLYSINFDTRILDIVFENTDKSISIASTCIESAFLDFYDIGEVETTSANYETLERKIKLIAKNIRLETDKMLRTVVLDVKC